MTPASFEPTLDYVVVKIPRWAFEKFPDASPTLGTQMKSVGEVMAIGRTFKEALQKGLRGLETGVSGFARDGPRRRAHQAEAAPRRPRPHLLRRRARSTSAGSIDEIDAHDRRSTRGSSTSSQQIVELEKAARRLDSLEPIPGRALCARGQAHRLLRRAARRSSPARPRTQVRARAQGRRHRPGLQARRHLRRRVRVATRRTSTRPTSASTRRRPTDAQQGHDPRQRAEPHRAGHRVRLLLLPRRLRAQGGRLRDDHGQLQPGDGLDRLRHLGPPLLRAAHARGRAEHRRDGEARGRHRAVRRPDAAQARAAAARARASRSSAPAPTRSTSPRTASASARCSTSSTSRSPRAAPRRSLEEAKAVAEPHRLPGAGAAVATCSAGARWRSSTTRAASKSTCAKR